MFGCCVAGRLLQTNLQQVDETHATFDLPGASTINHICVFLLGTVPFPDGYGATVHLYWPGKGLQLLGMLSNDKPSAIFRLRTSTDNPSVPTESALSPAAFPPNLVGDITAVLGLSIEPLPDIYAQMSTLQSALVPSAPDLTKSPAVLAEKIVMHLFNYVSGFVGGVVTPETLVPLNIIARWYEAFQGKLRAGGIGFLERAE